MKCMNVLMSGLVGCLLLSGCSTIQFDEVASAGAATAGATVGALVAGPPGAIAGGVAAGTATVVVTPKSNPNGVDLELVPEDQRAGVAKYQETLNLVREFGWWIAIGLGAWFFVPLLIGYFLPNGKQRKMHRDAFNDPSKKM